MTVTVPQLFPMSPKAQDALEQAIKSGDLNYPDPDQEEPGPMVYRYNDEPDNAYIDVQFIHGEVVVRDGADPTGAAHKFTQDQWRAWTGQPSRQEAAEDVRRKNEKAGVGLDGVKTGE